MSRKAFLLGLYATGGQILLLRELISSLNGDELFLGTALFGWLVWVAAGAWFGGRVGRNCHVGLLFAIGAALLPATIAAVRLCPLLFSETVGEIIPFTSAALLSILVTSPVGIVSGWLFPLIAGAGEDPSKSVVRAYLFEGIGAFAGGVIILIMVGETLSTSGMTLTLAVVVICGSLWLQAKTGLTKTVFMVLPVVVVPVIALYLGPSLDRYSDSVKYRPFVTKASFDTHYGHQAVLSRDDMVVLITDNAVEAIHPDLETVENSLLPPLLYHPVAKRVLITGRTELGVAQLADSFPDLSLVAVDPRQSLTRVLDSLIAGSSSAIRIHEDPLSFFSQEAEADSFDIVILPPVGLDTYKNSRLITSEFLGKVKTRLCKDGLLCLLTQYDTDRYITSEVRDLLAIIYNVMSSSFDFVTMWPGNTTLFFATDNPATQLPFDSLQSRLSRLSYSPKYVNEFHLQDRLNLLRLERLQSVTGYLDEMNSVEKPVLPHYQALYRSTVDSANRALLAMILNKPWWILTIPILIVVFLVLTVVPKSKSLLYGSFLYFTAGAASLSIELISFYVYQSLAGSLYSEMAVMIGTFMLGLALGTYYASKTSGKRIERLALLILAAATLIFLGAYGHVPYNLLLPFHLLFLLTAACATGSLFVSATVRYYPESSSANRGSGYALELAGSSLGALFSISFLLPVIGLSWLLLSLVLLITLALVGSLLTN